MKFMKAMKLADWIVFTALLLLSGIFSIVIFYFANPKLPLLPFNSGTALENGYLAKEMQENLEVIVRISGKEISKFSQPGGWVIRDLQGKYVTNLHFDGKSIFVTNSNCPDKICEKTGKVGVGGSIICVPNRMIIQLKKVKTSKVNQIKQNFEKEIDVETW